MIRLRKILMLFMVIILSLSLINITQVNTFAKSDLNKRDTTNVGVLFYSLGREYAELVKHGLEEIQKDNETKVSFTFFDGKNNISIQNAILSNMINNDFDLLVVYLLNLKESELQDIILKIKQKDIPIIFLGVNQQQESILSKYYSKVAFLSADFKKTGIEQGKIIADLWNNSRDVIDKNEDNILNYIILKGKKDSPIAKDRTDGFISTINNFGIKVKQLEEIDAQWNRELAKNAITSLFLRYDGSIEAIIANNDDMAIGAVEALQGYGYNKGDKSKNVIIIGIDGLQEAKELVDKGFMTATIVYEQGAIADAIYNVGMNLVNNLNPLENTNYKLENGKIIVPIPYSIYMNKPNI